jgi:hypothetical protein
MTVRNYKSWMQYLALIAIIVSGFGTQRATAEDTRPSPQYVYKVIGDRQLKADVLCPDDWKATDERAAIVFFSGGAWPVRTGSLFRSGISATNLAWPCRHQRLQEKAPGLKIEQG